MKTKFIGLCLISLAALSASAFAQNPSRIANMSARVRSGPGASTSIVGFSVPSGQNKSILARIVGPSLSSFGIQGGLMADPVATLYDRAGRVIVQNDNWETQPGFGGADYRLLIRGERCAPGDRVPTEARMRLALLVALTDAGIIESAPT